MYKRIVWPFLAVVLARVALSGADTGFRGIVTDEAGKPVRAAIVKATAGYKGVIRYTQADGRYEMALPPGKYSVSVEAFGFGARILDKDAAQPGDTNFSLTRRVDLAHVSGADLEHLLPDNEETRRIVGTCIECHGIEYIMRRRGFTADQWRTFIPTMTSGKVVPPRPNPPEMIALTAALEKYFGPRAPYFAPGAEPPKPEQLEHVDPSDEVLKAVGSSRVDLQACKLEYSIVSPK